MNSFSCLRIGEEILVNSLEENKKKKNLGKYKEALVSLRLFLKREALNDNLRLFEESGNDSSLPKKLFVLKI